MEGEAVRLRPMGVTEIVDTTFALYRRNIILFAGVTAVLAVPETLINVAVVAATPTVQTTSGSVDATQVFQSVQGVAAASSVNGVVGFIFGTLITAALAVAIANRFLGRPITIVQAYTAVGLATFIRLLAAIILLFVGAGVGFAGVIVGLVFATIALSSVSTALAVLFAIVSFVGIAVFVVWAALHFVFVTQVIVLERSGIFDAYRRSWYLVRGSWWRVLGLVLLVSVLVSVVTGIVGIFAGILSLGHPALTAGISGAISIFVQPIQYGALTLLYYDQRIRKEGFDLEYAAQAGHWQPA